MGLGQDVVSDLRAGRVELAQSAGANLSYVERLGRLLEAPSGEASGVREAA